MKVLIVNSAEKGIEQFLQPIVLLLAHKKICTEVIGYSESLHIQHTRYNAAILTASPCGNDIVDQHLHYYEWIRDYDKPLLGICAGHQIIGRMFGASLMKGREKEKGNVWVTIDRYDRFLKGYRKKILVKQNHHDSITLPEEFIPLAHSDKCLVQAMRHRIKPFYSTQFHAEMMNSQLILNFIDITSEHLRETVRG